MTPEIQKLDWAIVEAVYALFTRAKEAQARGDLAAAAEACQQAWQAIPEPRYGWDSSYMFVLCLAKFGRGACPTEDLVGIVNGYLVSGFGDGTEGGLYFCLGTLELERGDQGRAFDHFDQAQRISGGRCFQEEDPRYRQFYRDCKAGKRLTKSGKAH